MTLATPARAGTLARAQRRYAEGSAPATTPERLVVLLYERLVRDLDEAVAALEAGGSAHASLVHAQDVLAALEAALDPAAWDGGSAMAALYDHLQQQLVTANLRRDAAVVAQCREIVAPLAEAWRQAWATLAR
jgi:flagellar protein FliS